MAELTIFNQKLARWTSWDIGNPEYNKLTHIIDLGNPGYDQNTILYTTEAVMYLHNTFQSISLILFYLGCKTDIHYITVDTI